MLLEKCALGAVGPAHNTLGRRMHLAFVSRTTPRHFVRLVREIVERIQRLSVDVRNAVLGGVTLKAKKKLLS